jgi:hypothetical protein
MISQHEEANDLDVGCVPCDTTGLAQALHLPAQVVADRLKEAIQVNRLITATAGVGGTNPYFFDIKLTANGRAAVRQGA